jgi:two-component system, cell cycle response regulator
MSLKVVLADESTTIKKAFQLALSEFAVEVKSVPSGLDVLSVCQGFKPDIIFADVLLTKKSGYEVCKEIKIDPNLKSTPVILMWSGFMDFDTPLAEQAGYTDRLEKPFDAQMLKDKISKYVTKMKSHPLRDLIESPRLPDFEESDTLFRQKNLFAAQTKDIPPKTPELGDDSPEVKMPQTAASATPPPRRVAEPAYDEMDVHIETENYGDFEEVVLVKTEQPDPDTMSFSEHLQDYLEHSPVSLNKAHLKSSPSAPSPSASASRFDEQLMREEIKLVAEKICWQIIPEVTERIVREEISKLMAQIEKNT